MNRYVAFAVGLMFALGAADVGSQSAGLKIVVIEGEDAVNIVHQRTAVAAIVEVRDRNDQPVAGTSVRFAIRNGRATFNGARTLTVTTDAAGRASVTGLTPTGPGPLQISASASFRGETATATVTQTNSAAVTTGAGTGGAAGGAGAAAGAGAAGAVAAGGAAAGAAAAGGGLGAAAITGIAAAAGGGAFIAAKEAGLIGKKPDCVFTVSPSSFNITGQGSITAGPEPSVNVTLADDNCEPTGWTATSNASFITFRGTDGTGGLATVDNRGTGLLFFSVPANTPGGPARTGTFTVAGQTITVSQNAACLYSITPTSLVFPSGGGTRIVNVNVTPSSCDVDSWIAVSISNFLSISPAGGKGTGAVSLTATPISSNPIAPRTGNISIGPGGSAGGVSQSLGGVIIQFVQQ